ncbi:MAG TPA: leucyl/phenylalanyl-tRNA--protein transferase [Pseudomonadaceae bacterium]|nr:leucyl/phenylalanyl-tRNA--protein transferase [Pseudomonadaceae bacterium]
MSTQLQWLDDEDLAFPDPASALPSPNGLLAVGGDLRPERLLRAYQAGIFPWFEADQPILWWSPNPRMVLFPAELHLSRSMQKFLRRHPWRISSDSAFDAVVAACAGVRAGSDGTWITPAMAEAYGALHRAGHAHSVEVWEGEQLVGGLYGIAMGRVFFGESMFSQRSNASKLALADLAGKLQEAGYRLIDCQVANPHLASLGARNISRQQFCSLLPGREEIGRVADWPYNRTNPPSSAVAKL